MTSLGKAGRSGGVHQGGEIALLGGFDSRHHLVVGDTLAEFGQFGDGPAVDRPHLFAGAERAGPLVEDLDESVGCRHQCDRSRVLDDPLHLLGRTRSRRW